MKAGCVCTPNILHITFYSSICNARSTPLPNFPLSSAQIGCLAVLPKAGFGKLASTFSWYSRVLCDIL